MKKILIASMMLISVPFIGFAQSNATTTTAPAVVLEDPGFIPGDFFYFLDRWTESMNYFLTFKPESKALLALDHARERASEVKSVLKERGAQSSEAAQAKQDFADELKLASTIVADQKSQGKDVSAFIKEIDDEFEMSKDMLKEAYHGHRDELKSQEKDLQNKLKDAIKAGDTAMQASIEAEIKAISQDASAVLDEEDSVEDDFDVEKGHIEEAMGDKTSAESHIANAERTYDMLVKDAQASGLPLNQIAVQEYTKLIADAKTAFAAGNFETAKKDAKEANKTLHEAERGVNMKEFERGFLGGEKNSRGNDMMDEEKERGMGMPSSDGLRGATQTKENAERPDFNPGMGIEEGL